MGASLVVSNGALEHLYGGPAALFARLPAVWVSHNTWVAEEPINRVIALVPAAAVIANSRHTLRALPARLRRKARRVHFGVAAMPPDVELRSKVERLLSREQLHHPLIVCSGGVAPLKER